MNPALPIWKPSLWWPWRNPLAAFLSTGKVQRNPTTGKVQRDAATGKAWRGDAANNTCCCGGTPCIFCNILFLRAHYTFSGGGGDFPIGMFDGDYCLPFDRVGGPANNQCFFRGICPIFYDGPSTGLHYKAMEVSAPGFFRDTSALHTNHLIIPSGNSFSIRMWDSMNVAHTAASGTISTGVVSATTSCDDHLAFATPQFTMDLVKDNGCSGAPLCTGPFCVKSSPILCGF